MIRNIVLIMVAVAASLNVFAQSYDNNGELSSLQFSSKNNQTKFSVGGRLFVDAANVSGDYTPVRSGVAISNARINTSLQLGEQWYLKADFDFAYGEFAQKDLYARFSWGENKHWIKAGYYAEPLSMNRNTSSYNTLFINRPTSVNALAEGRNLGISYRFSNDKFFANQGVFAGNEYNDQIAGFQGINASGRWLYKALNDNQRTLHVGFGFGYQKINGGAFSDGVLRTSAHVGSSLPTTIKQNSEFMGVDIPWASDILTYNIEALYRANKFFVRGEYTFQNIQKNDRDDQRLFENQLGGGIFASSTLEAWRKLNPLRDNNFSGGYIEAGYLVFGEKYSYDNANGLVGAVKGENTLQVLMRYSYTNLNDIVDGDVYSYAQNRFYKDGEILVFSPASTSLAGGAMHNITLGVNYGINEYVKILVDYTYSIYDNVRMPLDNNFGIIQARLALAF